jgi:PAS domain S-box-containing protein
LPEGDIFKELGVDKMIAREIMSTDLLSVQITEPLDGLVTLIRENFLGCLVFQDGKSIIGVTRGKCLYDLLAAKVQSVSDVIEKPVKVITENGFIDETIQKLAINRHHFILVVDRNGKPVGYLSPEKLLDLAYNEINKLNSIVSAIPIGIIAIDKHGSMTIVNDAAEKLLKIEASECIGQHISRTNHSTELIELLHSEEACSTRKSKQGELTLVVKHNLIKCGEIVIGAVEVFQDISELERIISELESVKAINEELETIIRSSYDEIFVTDGQGITIKVSDSVKKSCGIPSEFFIGRSVDELEKEGLFVPSATKKAIAKKEIVTVTSVTNLGKEIVTTATPVFNDKGDVVKVICNVRDFTELSRLKKLLEETENIAQIYKLKLAKLDSKRTKLDSIIGISPQIVGIKEMICKVADLETHIFLTGESGTGKGIVARSIHATSNRAKHPFITVNCGAIPESLVESELFGYAPGAFTGAGKEGKKGLAELAARGTLFLDEIAEMPLNLQVKLLAFIQDKRYFKVGSNKEYQSDARIIAATNKNPRELVEKRKLREDLYYRLNVVPIHIPPLRDRYEDIEPLIEYKMSKLNELYQTHKELKSDTREILINYTWPGNVRELENVLERSVITSETYEIGPENLPDYISLNNTSQMNSHVSVSKLCTLEEAISEVEKQLLQKARFRCKTTTKMAEVLGVNQSTIVRKLKRYSIS